MRLVEAIKAILQLPNMTKNERKKAQEELKRETAERIWVHVKQLCLSFTAEEMKASEDIEVIAEKSEFGLILSVYITDKRTRLNKDVNKKTNVFLATDDIKNINYLMGVVTQIADKEGCDYLWGGGMDGLWGFRIDARTLNRFHGDFYRV